jgi:hypothetical protein
VRGRKTAPQKGNAGAAAAAALRAAAGGVTPSRQTRGSTGRTGGSAPSCRRPGEARGFPRFERPERPAVGEVLAEELAEQALVRAPGRVVERGPVGEG